MVLIFSHINFRAFDKTFYLSLLPGFKNKDCSLTSLIAWWIMAGVLACSRNNGNNAVSAFGPMSVCS